MKFRKDIAAVLLFAALIVIGWTVIGHISDTYASQDTILLRDAVKQAALTCYAVEGAYPEDLEYLLENYAIAYDEDRYIISYDAFASNLLPEIRVHERSVAQ